MKIDQISFIKFAQHLSLNSVVGDEFYVGALAPYSISLHKNRDAQLASFSALPADCVTLDMEFSSRDEALVWCANHIRACAVSADFMRAIDNEQPAI